MVTSQVRRHRALGGTSTGANVRLLGWYGILYEPPNAKRDTLPDMMRAIQKMGGADTAPDPDIGKVYIFSSYIKTTLLTDKRIDPNGRSVIPSDPRISHEVGSMILLDPTAK